MALGGFGLQHWRARRLIKEKGKPGGDSPRQALQTESATWNTCRLRRIPTGGKNWRGSPGLGNGEKKREKEKGNGSWARGLNWARAELNAQMNDVNAN